MKIGKFVFLVMSIVLFTNCSNNDESSETITLNGIWNLKNVSGGLLGINVDYDPGEVTWNFNLENNILTVENNITTTGPEDIYAGLDSGTYSFQVQQNGDTEVLYINNSVRGVIVLLSENQLTLDDGVDADGFATVFER